MSPSHPTTNSNPDKEGGGRLLSSDGNLKRHDAVSAFEVLLLSWDGESPEL